MQIAIVLYDKFTALDAVGPYDVLQQIPGATVTFVGHEAREYRTELGQMGVMADATLADIANPDVVVIPGGFGTRAVMAHQPTLDWVRSAHETCTHMTSVCTGALVLGAAGLLEGLDATTHWSEAEALEATGANYVAERFVDHGKILTAAGVSAGIDMALHMVAKMLGDDMAKAVQLGIEYDPQPPFDAGTVAKAGPELTALVRAAMDSANGDLG